MANFRKHLTSSGLQVLAGKSAENNELLVQQAKPAEIVLHTKAPGSPFCNIKSKSGEKPTKKEIKEVAIFCAKYSQDWRDNKNDVEVHLFTGADIYKDKKMKLGTFGVKKFEKIKIKKSDIIKFEEKLK